MYSAVIFSYTVCQNLWKPARVSTAMTLQYKRKIVIVEEAIHVPSVYVVHIFVTDCIFWIEKIIIRKILPKTEH